MKSFLGKPVPSSTKRPLKKMARLKWMPLLVLPMLISGSLLLLQSQSLNSDSAQRATGGALSSVLSQDGSGTRRLYAPPATGTCKQEDVSAAFKNKDGKLAMFPLIPDGLNDSAKCTPAFWNITVVKWFVIKALAILNWFALAAAIVISLYAGLLYISGFANEANIKTAKNVLVSVYVGLAIVFLAKVLVYGSVGLVSDNPKEQINNAEETLQKAIDPTAPTPTP